MTVARHSFSIACALALGVLGPLVPSTARAQDDGECFPACRSGYTCVAGTCVSACNPPCPTGQSCQAGECVAPQTATQPQPTAQPQPQTTPGTTGGWGTAQPTAQPQPAAQPQPSSGPGATGGWVDTSGSSNGPPVAPGNDRRQELRRIRKQFHFVGYLSPTLVFLSTSPSNGVGFHELDGDGDGDWDNSSSDHLVLGIGAAIGVRFNFAHVVGFQARLYFDLLPVVSGHTVYVDEDNFIDTDACGDNPIGDCEATAVAFRLGADATFRIGPFAQAFPMYLGIGGYAGGQQISASSRGADYSVFKEDLGLLSELGFIFGETENMDLGVRLTINPEGGAAGSLSFGLAFASLGG